MRCRSTLRLAVCAALLTCLACKPQPGQTDDTATTQPATQPESRVTYVVVQKWEGGPANMELRVDTTYIGDDGTLQQSTETVTDKVLSARTGQVDAAELLRRVGTTEWPASSLGPSSPEYAPAHVNFFWGTSREPARAWTGPTEGLPEVAQNLLFEVERLVKQADLSALHEQRFVRAARLTPQTVAEYRRAGLFHELSAAQLATAALLSQALAFEQRLIPVPAGINPYAVIGKHFQARNSIEILVNGEAFQVRNLVAEESR